MGLGSDQKTVKAATTQRDEAGVNDAQIPGEAKAQGCRAPVRRGRRLARWTCHRMHSILCRLNAPQSTKTRQNPWWGRRSELQDVAPINYQIAPQIHWGEDLGKLRAIVQEITE